MSWHDVGLVVMLIGAWVCGWSAGRKQSLERKRELDEDLLAALRWHVLEARRDRDA